MWTYQQLIEKFKLEPLPQEGGYFRRIYESDQVDDSGRKYCASIYYLLAEAEFSCFHRIDCDELWHFYAGQSIIIHQILPNAEYIKTLLGNPLEDAEATPFTVVRKGVWFAAEIKNHTGFSLVGCTTTPEFVYPAFEVATHKQLASEYPQHQELIARLTRQ
jgi:predicted cupin superfamily sugar epimerase